jgi:hypothetical protein
MVFQPKFFFTFSVWLCIIYLAWVTINLYKRTSTVALLNICKRAPVMRSTRNSGELLMAVVNVGCWKSGWALNLYLWRNKLLIKYLPSYHVVQLKFLPVLLLCAPLLVQTFVFAENKVTGVMCLYKLETFCFPQLDKPEDLDIIFQQLLLSLFSATLCGTI